MQSLVDFLKTAFDTLFLYLLCPVNYLLDFFANIALSITNDINPIDFGVVNVSSEMSYVLEYLSFQPAFLTISSAYSIRFLIRRIPFFN